MGENEYNIFCCDYTVEKTEEYLSTVVMNEHFLREMRFATIEWHDKLIRRSIGQVSHVELIDTTPIDTDMQMVAKNVFDSISNSYPELEFQLTSAR